MRPPFVVRRTVPTLPLAQTTRSLTTDSPRSLAVEPVGLSSQEYSRLPPDVNASDTTETATSPTRSATRLNTARKLTTPLAARGSKGKSYAATARSSAPRPSS